jgi:hypothetical protein
MISNPAYANGWRSFRAYLCASIVCFGLAWTEQPASAKQSPDVVFGVTVIHATRTENGMDPALKPLETYLRNAFKQYRQFKRLQHRDLKVTKGHHGALKLPDGKTLSLKYLDLKKGFVKVHLSLDSLDTTLDIKDGGLFFQAGRVFKGGIIVLAISARTKI